MSRLATMLIGVSLALMLVLGLAVGYVVSDDEAWDVPMGSSTTMHGTGMDHMSGQHMASLPNHMRAMGMSGMGMGMGMAGMAGMSGSERDGMPPMHGHD